MILEKIPERLLAQYYRWLDENKYRDSLKTLKDWVSEEAAYLNTSHRDQKRNLKSRSK